MDRENQEWLELVSELHEAYAELFQARAMVRGVVGFLGRLRDGARRLGVETSVVSIQCAIDAIEAMLAAPIEFDADKYMREVASLLTSGSEVSSAEVARRLRQLRESTTPSKVREWGAGVSARDLEATASIN